MANKHKKDRQSNRSVFYQWNLGTRDMKTEKHPNRSKRKATDRKESEEN